MTLEELIFQMRNVIDSYSQTDKERMHELLDHLLLRYIGDVAVTALFDSAPKWYS